MADYSHQPVDLEEDAGSLNSTFNVLVIVLLLGFVFASSYF